MSDLRQRLLGAFEAETREHLESIRGIVQDRSRGEGPAAGPALEEAFRRAHNLKGAARSVDLKPVESLAHRLETLFSRVREGGLSLDREALAAVAAVLDAIEDWVAAYLSRRTPAEPAAALEAIDRLLGSDAAAPRLESPAPPPAAPEAVALEESVRVKAEALDRLLRTSEELLGSLLPQDLIVGELSRLGLRLAEMERQAGRLRGPAGRVRGKPPADSGGQAAEGSALERQARGLERDLRRLRERHARGAWTLRQLAQELSLDVRRVRMVPAESVFAGLRKIVRDLARQEGKEAQLLLEGLELESDRLVLQALKDPLMHLLRNCVSHGIEPAEERRRKGKEPVGRIRLSLRCAGGTLDLQVEDDGRGVDWKEVARAGVRGRLLAEEKALTASAEELSPLLFEPGLTTAPEVTEVSGRGMGLSVVREALRRLRGSLELDWTRPGFSISIRVPVSGSTERLLLVACAARTFAVPFRSIETLARVGFEEVRTVEGRPAVTIRGQALSALSLSALLGLGESDLKVEGEAVPIVVVKDGPRRAALAVESLTGELEAIVRDLGPGGRSGAAFTGGVLLPDGSVALVLDCARLLEPGAGAGRFGVWKAERAAAPKGPAAILVVDDSITTRTLEKSILEAHGYRVSLAVDGLEALERLRAETPDLAIVDIQMPRMDGFALIAAMKKDPRLVKIPVIVVSSRDDQADRERGLALGADAYILKRKFDHQGLLETIGQMI